MMASHDTALYPTIQEDKTSGQCRKSRSSNNSGRLSKSSNNSQDSKGSKSSSQSRSAQFNYSNDFRDNASRTAVNGSKDSICSEENSCGTSQKYYHEDFLSGSSKTSMSEESGSCTIPLPQTPKTKEWNLPEKKKKNDPHTKVICHLGGFFNAGGKILPKKKPPQKTTSITNHTINAQEKNNMAYRLLSAKDHKIKELKNEAAVLQNKLKTFTTENKILKRLQSRHLKAISKYENAEINLPDLLATRSSEVQTLKAHLRTSQKEERRASKKLRDVQAQLLKTTDSLRALQKLSGDKKLEEREQLQCKLTSLTQKLEACDKKTQDMEKQLSSNTISFRHQLSVEKKKIIEAQSIRANLQVEIKSLKLKLQEIQRELSITNIYAHRMHKGQPEKGDSSSSPKVVKVNKAIQVNISLNAMKLQKPEPEVSPMICREEMKANIGVEELFNMAENVTPKTEVHLCEKLPVHNISNQTFMVFTAEITFFAGLQSEETCPRVEKNIHPENTERQKNRRERQGLDLLKQEFEKLQTEPSFLLTPCVQPKENNLEDVTVEKQENKDEAKEAVCHKLTRHRTTSTFKKQYVFSEAIQNLHQGYPSTGPLVNPKIPSSRRSRNWQQGETGDFVEDSVSSYEPSFAKFPKERQKDNPSTLSEENSPKIPPEKKRLLLEKLFGPNRILNTK
ncbi:lebercilin-like protein [Pseudonaja textilis]|uniref:lebercilin-like protein n=1 Tax=Pseudonaja textilis TaxID=8673 RepID=UPI000EA901BC|nr:lebercilin-like protein [Pseudonaja textilis]